MVLATTQPGALAQCVEAHLPPANARTRMCGPAITPRMVLATTSTSGFREMRVNVAPANAP